MAMEDDCVNQKIEDINDLAKSGKLPDDPKRHAVPVNKKAKDQAEEDARICYDDEMMRASVIRATTRLEYAKVMTTGHFQIDNDTGGFSPGFVWYIGADTSWGKSSHAIMCSDENQKRGFRTLIVSWEDSEELYADRFVIRRADVRPEAYKWHRRGRVTFTGEELRRVMDVERAAEHKPLFLNAIGKSVEWVAAKIKLMVKMEGIHLVLIDYLQAADNEKPMSDRRSQVDYIARTLSDALKISGAAGCVYSQITVSEKKATPDRHSLKESRTTANIAEVVALGFDAPSSITLHSGEVIGAGQKVLFVDKVKNGPPKRVHELDWNRDGAWFRMRNDPMASAYDDFDNQLQPPHF